MNKEEKIRDLKEKIRLKKLEYSAVNGEQQALKIFLNSFYGIFSNEYFRYFDMRLASAVTCLGQVSVKGPGDYLIEKIPDLSIVYQDTDSLFISFQKLIERRFTNLNVSIEEKRNFVKKLAKEIVVPTIADYYKKFSEYLNSYKNTYDMGFEVIADRNIFLAKKKYVQRLVMKDGYDLDLTKKPDLKIRGVEIVRTSTPMFVREQLKKIVELMMVEYDNKKCIRYIDKFKKDFFTKPFEDVAFPRGIYNIQEYSLGQKSLPIHVRGALLYNKFLEDNKLKHLEPISNSSKVKFCYIKTPNQFESNIIAFPNKVPDEFKNLFQIDYEMQFDKSALAPLKLIFETINWNTESKASILELF